MKKLISSEKRESLFSKKKKNDILQTYFLKFMPT